VTCEFLTLELHYFGIFELGNLVTWEFFNLGILYFGNFCNCEFETLNLVTDVLVGCVNKMLWY
jgi:hypothetical protein